MRLISVLLLLLVTTIFSQSVKVIKNDTISTDKKLDYSHIQFVNENTLLASTTAYRGLYLIEVESGKVKELNNYNSAGYYCKISADGKNVVYRNDSFENGRKYSAIISQELETGKELLLQKKIRGLSVPELTDDGKIFYTRNSAPVVKSKKGTEEEVSEVVVYNENAKIVVLDGDKKVLAPFGEGNYIWSELSPDGTMVLFTYAGKGTFVCDLNGKIKYELGYANASKWAADGDHVVFMRDYDDGHKVTSSEIYIYKLSSGETFNITNTENSREYFPSFSKDGKKVVTSDDDGNIYIITLDY